MTEIKPCPFCGGEPWVFTMPIYGEVVACSKPRCGGHEIRLPPNKWNTRHTPASHDAVREALEGCEAIATKYMRPDDRVRIFMEIYPTIYAALKAQLGK